MGTAMLRPTSARRVAMLALATTALASAATADARHQITYAGATAIDCRTDGTADQAPHQRAEARAFIVLSQAWIDRPEKCDHGECCCCPAHRFGPD